MRLDSSHGRPRLDIDDPALRLTEAQKRALAIDRELVVTAGAGAGKTFTLSLRYVALLLELACVAVEADPRSPRPDIEAVLVLTFTEKAAEEMAERCYRRLLGLSQAVRAAPSGPDPLEAAWPEGSRAGLAAALDHLVDTFDRARIGTFHGFCASVLREFPAEAATPPDFEVLDELDARELADEVVDGVLHGAYDRDPERLGLLVGALGSHGQVREALLALLRRRDVLGGIMRRHASGRFGVRELLDLFPLTPVGVQQWLETEGVPLLEEIRLAVARPPAVGDQLWQSVYLPLQQADALLEQGDPDAFALFDLYRTVLQGLCTKSGTLRRLDHGRFIGNKSTWNTVGMALRDDCLVRMQELMLDARDWPQRLVEATDLPSRADVEMLGALEVLGELFGAAVDRLHARFAEDRVVDFTTLQERAVRAVLGHAGLQQRLAARHRYLMVDEFQDTDEAQWDLVRALGRPDGRSSDRIFVVGDAKQSIYRFRGGDVTVFRRATRELGVEPVVLPENFRSRTELIDWFNHFFHRLMGPPAPRRPAHEAAYEPLAPGRGATGGSVTLAVHERERAQVDAAREAEGVARLLAGRVLAGEADFEALKLHDRDAHPTPPVAVLLRARTRLSLYEDALRRHGVPFVVAKGVGFWSRPEVRDPVLLLHAVATGDPISTAGALRTPLLGLSDQDLQDLVDGQWSEPVDGHPLATLGAWELDDLAPARVQRAAALLARWRGLRHRLPVSDLVRTLLDDTAAAHVHALSDAADSGAADGQAAANAERLIELLSRFDDRGPLGLDEAAHHALDQVLSDTPEAEAPVTPTEARVVLLTVHASKGLEFPVVVVPECGSRARGRHAPVVHGRIDDAWHVASRALDPEDPVRRRVRTGLGGLLDRMDREQELAESQRLLYVAATRARDHLVLVGTHSSDAERDRPRTWSEMLAWVHGTTDLTGQGLLTDTGGGRTGLEVGCRDHLDIVALDDWLELPVPERPAAPAPAPPPDQAPAELAPVLTERTVQVSPSSLDAFARDRKTWFRRERLGVRDQVAVRAEIARILAAARGEVLHSLLEDDVADDPDVAAARWRARAFAEGATPEQVEAELPQLLGHAARASADPRVQDRLAAPGMAEVKFRLDHAGVTLTGQIDRLWRDDEAGGWVVLDWKSGRVAGDPVQAAREHVRQLVAYAWAADRILRAQGQDGVVRAELYFSDVGALVGIGPLTSDHLRAVEAELALVGQVAARSWAEVTDEQLPAPTGVPVQLIGSGYGTRPAHDAPTGPAAQAGPDDDAPPPDTSTASPDVHPGDRDAFKPFGDDEGTADHLGDVSDEAPPWDEDPSWPSEGDARGEAPPWEDDGDWAPAGSPPWETGQMAGAGTDRPPDAEAQDARPEAWPGRTDDRIDPDHGETQPPALTDDSPGEDALAVEAEHAPSTEDDALAPKGSDGAAGRSGDRTSSPLSDDTWLEADPMWSEDPWLREGQTSQPPWTPSAAPPREQTPPDDGDDDDLFDTFAAEARPPFEPGAAPARVDLEPAVPTRGASAAPRPAAPDTQAASTSDEVDRAARTSPPAPAPPARPAPSASADPAPDAIQAVPAAPADAAADTADTSTPSRAPTSRWSALSALLGLSEPATGTTPVPPPPRTAAPPAPAHLTDEVPPPPTPIPPGPREIGPIEASPPRPPDTGRSPTDAGSSPGTTSAPRTTPPPVRPPGSASTPPTRTSEPALTEVTEERPWTEEIQAPPTEEVPAWKVQQDEATPTPPPVRSSPPPRRPRRRRRRSEPSPNQLSLFGTPPPGPEENAD